MPKVKNTSSQDIRLSKGGAGKKIEAGQEVEIEKKDLLEVVNDIENRGFIGQLEVDGVALPTWATRLQDAGGLEDEDADPNVDPRTGLDRGAAPVGTGGSGRAHRDPGSR